jgi:hypothetical protein
MSVAVRKLLDSFDSLLPGEKQEAVVEILRRVPTEAGDLPDDVLTATADDLFRALDEAEVADARP